MKFFHSNMPNAPVLTKAAGSLVSLLNACLVDGFGLKTATSLVVSGNVATLTVPAPHSAVPLSTILVAGATPNELNGEFVVSAVTSTEISFPITLANQTATGTITVKQAAAGWSKPFSSGNVATYRSLDPTGTQRYLRVDDGPVVNARVVGYETMTAVSTGSGPFPAVAQVSGGLFWPKGHASETRAISWYIFADSRSFYYAVAHGPVAYSSQNNYSIFHFGDVIARKTIDPYACLLTGDRSDLTENAFTGAGVGCVGLSCRDPNAPISSFFPRSHTALGTSTGSLRIGAGHISESQIAFSGTSESSTNYSWVGTPNPSDNGILLNDLLLINNSSIRGHLPGMYHVTQNAANAIAATGDTLLPTGLLTGKTLLAVRVGLPGVESSKGLMFFNISGTWR